MAINFGLNKDGYVAPTYEEWLDDIEEEMRSRFPPDIVLTTNSNLGIIARMYAYRLTDIGQELEKIYYSPFVSTGTETALDRIGANYGIKRKVATPSHAQITIVTDGEYLIEAGEQFMTDDGYLFDLENDVLTAAKDGKWQGTGTVQCEDTGTVTNVEPNTITMLANPDDMVLSVTNPEKAVGGQDRETDSEYRERIMEENANRPSPTRNGIKSALLEVQGVRQVSIVENQSAGTDAYGNPPYSVHIYCLGGDKQDIADCLIQHIAAGITLTGTVSVDAVDATGNIRKIYFDYAKDCPIYVSVKLETNDAWNQDEGAEEVKEIVRDYINDLKMGEKVHITRMYPDIYSIAGIEDAQILIGRSKDTEADSDIAIDKFEAPSCKLDDVEVTVNG